MPCPYSEPEESSYSLTFLMVHYHIILPYTPSSFKWPFPSLFRSQVLNIFLFSPVHATHPVHLMRIAFDHYQRPTTCKSGSPDEGVTDLFSVRLNESQLPVKQKAAVIKKGQKLWWHHTPTAGTTPVYSRRELV